MTPRSWLGSWRVHGDCNKTRSRCYFVSKQVGINLRILIVGRRQDRVDRTTAILERVGHIVTSTLDDGVALDLVGSSQFDALLIDREVFPPKI